MRSFFILFVIFILQLPAISADFQNQTIINLNKAFRGETNASHRYELFAQKAHSDDLH